MEVAAMVIKQVRAFASQCSLDIPDTCIQRRYFFYNFLASTNVGKLSSLLEEAIGHIEGQSCVTWKLRDGEQYFVRIVNGQGLVLLLKYIYFCFCFNASSQTMGLSPQTFSPTHGSTMLHSLVYIKNMHEPYYLLGEPETEEQHAYITRNFIGQEEVTEVMYI